LTTVGDNFRFKTFAHFNILLYYSRTFFGKDLLIGEMLQGYGLARAFAGAGPAAVA
jgi:hypothetical protein